MKTRRFNRFAAITLSVFTLSVFTLFYQSDNALTKSVNAILAPGISATKIGVLDPTNVPTAGDLNNNGVINPGDRLTYTITIPNAGPDAATGVSLSDTIDANTTLVNGSLVASPVAVNDSYSTIGNVGISVPDGAGDLLSNDLDANNPGNASALVFTKINNTNFSSGTAVPTTHGSVKVNADGSFTYAPNAGFEGSGANADTFTYTLSNGTGLTDTSTVSINVSGMIWFVNNAAGACSANCDGRLSNPFPTLSAFQAVNNGTGTNPSDGDSVFVYTGSSAYTGGVTLRAGQKLIGQGAVESILSITGYAAPSGTNQLPATGAARPTIVNTSLNAITVATNNDIRGLTANAANNAAIFGSGAGGTTNISNVVISTSNTGSGISLTNQTGTLTVGNSSIVSSSSGTAVYIDGGNANVTFSNTPVSQNGGRVVDVRNRMGGTVTFNNNSTVTGTNGTSDGLSLRNNTGGAGNVITFSNNVNITTTLAGARALQADNSTGNFTLNMTASGNTLTSTGGAAMDIEDIAANLIFTSIGSTNSTTYGVRVNNTTGSINFGNTGTTGSDNTGVLLTSNASTLTFSDLDIAPDSVSRGLHATNNSGLITTSSGTITAAANTAVEVSGNSAAITTPVNITLTSVSSSGNAAPNGIILSNTSGTGFSIVGTGGNCTSAATCTGGAIANKTGADLSTTQGTGIYLNNVANVSLNRMQLNDFQNFAIRAEGVTNFTMRDSIVNGSSGTSHDHDEAALRFGTADVSTGIKGTALFEGNTIGGGYEDNLGIFVVNNDTLTVNVKDNTSSGSQAVFNNNNATEGNDGLHVSSRGTSNVTVTVDGVTFNGARGDLLQVTSADSAIQNITIQNNSFLNMHPGIVSGGGNINVTGVGGNPGINVTYRIHNNILKGSRGAPLYSMFGGFAGTINGVITNNIVGTPNSVFDTSQANRGAVDGIGFFGGIDAKHAGTGVLNYALRLEGNTFRDLGATAGILLRSATFDTQGTGRFEATIKNNTLAETGSVAGGIYAQGCGHGNLNSDSGKMGLDIIGNALNLSGSPGAADAVVIDQSAIPCQFYFPGYSGPTNPSNQFSTYLTSKGNTWTLPAAGSSGTGGAYVNANISGGNLVLSVPAFAGPVEEPTDKAAVTFNELLNLQNTSHQTSLEMLTSIEPLFRHSTNTETISQTEIAQNETAVQTDETISQSETIETREPDYRTKVSAFINSTSSVMSELASKVGSAIMPTVSAQETEKIRLPNEQLAPKSGETVTKSLGTIPAGEQIVVQFKVTVDANIPSNDYSVSNQATISGSNFSDILTDGDAVTGGIQPTVTNVVQPPSISKAFGTPNIAVNGVTSLTFTITNGNVGQSYSQLSFSDTLQSGLIINTPNGMTNTCAGTVTATANTNIISLSNGTLSAPLSAGTTTTCTIKVDVKGTAEGTVNNVSGAVSSLQGGTGNTASATVNIITAPSFTKAFGAAEIQLNNSTTLTFTITNNSSIFPLSNVSFTDNLPAGLVVAATPNVSNSCSNGTVTANAGTGTISLSGATLSPSSNCVIIVNVTGTSAGLKNNLVSLSTAELGTGATATAIITVTLPPADLTVTKTHTGSFTQGDTGKTYTITVTNSGGTSTSGTVSVVDTLPSGLTVTAISGTGWTCTFATLICTRVDALASSSSYPPITLTVDVAANAPASVTNTATVSGGGEINTANNTATDPTTVIPTATYSISGKVTNGGEALSGVSVALIGTSTASTTTDAVGNYSFSSLNTGTYTVTPTLNGYTFVQSSITVSNISADQTNQNFATSETSYEGDVANRPSGDKTVDIFDMIATGNIIANLPNTAPLANGGEYQRADAAPRSSKGDGSVDVQDLVVMGLYAAALDPLTPAGGPTAPIPPPPGDLIASIERGESSKADEAISVLSAAGPSAGTATVSAGTVTASGAAAIVPIQLTSSNIGAVQFSVTYDATKLSIPSDAAITDQAGNTLFTFNNTTAGQLGVVALRSPAGSAFPASTVLFNINFTVINGAPGGTSTIGFGSTPVPTKASDPAGEAATQTTLTPGTVTVLGPTAAPVSISGRVMTAAGRGIRNVQVTMIDSAGRERTAQTTSFGYYRFDNVEAGETVMLSAKARRFKFNQSSIVRTTNDSVTDADFVSIE